MMRVAALNLSAFGRFSDTELVFKEISPDFHLIYGANEAGKTTAVQAFRSLLYGIEERTPYAFLHPNPDLRIGARLTVKGKTHEIARRKGRKNTLQDGSGKPLEDAFLQQLLAAMEREQFERMFALTHGDLVAGGREIVAGQGEVGQALFAAGLGGISLSSLLRRTQDRLDDLFKPRATSKPLNLKLGQVRDLDTEIRNRQLSGEQWTRRLREAAEAQARLHELTEQCEALAQEQLRLQRLQRTLPLSGKWAELSGDLSRMAEVVPLPHDFDERRREAARQIENTTRSLAKSQQKLDEARGKAGGVEVADEWLQRAAEIEQLHERLGSHKKGQSDGVKLRAEHQAHLERLAELLTELPGPADLAEVLGALPDAGVRAAVEALAPRKQALDEALRLARKELEECQTALAEAAEGLAQLPPETDVSALKKTLTALQKQGDLEGESLKCEKAVAKEARAAQQQLERLALWHGVVGQVLELRTPLYETVGVFAERFRELEVEAQRLHDRETDLQAERAECQQRLQQLELAEAVPLEADLKVAREGRDTGWQLIKRRYLWEEQVDLDAYAPDGDVASRYEGQVTASDEVADRLRREAQSVHERADLETR
ncbi:MAG: AAA family ATPase, partial [Armatimonadetes bacterium]|nr:AAA family ATPase [Armatimonadota bacterium]